MNIEAQERLNLKDNDGIPSNKILMRLDRIGAAYVRACRRRCRRQRD